MSPRDMRVMARAMSRLLQAERERFTYKGVYRDGQQYVRGNFVTHSGSVWHCNTDAPSGKPGESKDWTLAVKGMK